MKRGFILFTVSIFLNSLFGQNEYAQDFFKPINLGIGKTQICLGDFFPGAKIKNVTIDKRTGYSIIDRREDTITVSKSVNHTNPMALLDVLVSNNGIDKVYSIPVKKSSKRLLNFTFSDPKHTLKQVQIKGTFNAWNAGSLNLNFINGQWFGAVWAAEGIHQYVYVLNGNKEVRDPNNKDSVSNGMGSYNSKLSIEAKSISLKTYSFSHQGNDLKLFLESDILNGLKKDAFKNIGVIALYNDERITKTMVNKKMNSQTQTCENSIVEIQVPSKAKTENLGYIRVWIYKVGTNEISDEVLVPLNHGEMIKNASQLSFKDPRTLIIYNPMIDRFNDGNPKNNKPLNRSDVNSKVDFWGGDIVGITQKIEDGYFKKLNINTLWVSPVVKNPEGPWGEWKNPNTKFSGYHGYWPISSTETDSRFCTKLELETFIKTAEKNGINVLLDYVAHHIHQDHPLFKNHPDWYTPLYLPDGSKNTERWDDHRLTTWFDDFMPTFNFFKPEVVEAMTDSAVWWMQNYPIYGFRHDATKHIPDVFWKSLTKKIKTRVLIPQKRTSYQIGETYGSPELIGSYIGSDLLDAQFDFNLYDAAVATFKQPNGNCKNLADIINDSKKNYGSHHTMGNITGNQDRPRFISLADGSLKDGENFKQVGWDRKIEIQDVQAYQRLQNLLALMVAVPGVPVVYYGDEIGMPGANDPDCRRMMRFGGEKDPRNTNEQSNFNISTSLLKLRKSEMSLLYGDCEVVSLNEHLLKVERNYFGDKLTFIFNTSNQFKNIDQTLVKKSTKIMLIENDEFKPKPIEQVRVIAPESFIILRD